MLPDESGRPFKRHGWDILLSNSDICTALSVPSCNIQKCAYFELGGVDHIVVFTDEGVLFYNGDETTTTYTTAGVTAINNTDYACYSGYDRCFFFEGDGTSAFYIYGDFKIWRYGSDFTLTEVTSLATVPRVLVGTSADCVGTLLEGYNLLGTLASVQYHDVDLFTYWCSDGFTIMLDDTAFKSNARGEYMWTYDTDNGWETPQGQTLTFANAGITVYGTPKDDDEIHVVYIYGVLLPNNVAQTQINDVKVSATTSIQFDTQLEVLDSVHASSLAAGKCVLYSDETANRDGRRAWIQFDATEAAAWNLGEEDIVKVVFPSVKIEITQYTGEVSTSTSATLVGA